MLLVCVSAQAQQSWQGQNIYQIVTDRFFNGDLSNDNADGNYNPAAGQAVHDGDFKGIEQKLDYIKALGATAIWISPVVTNGNGDYHGYAGRDFYHIDPHFGSVNDLTHLIQTAHAKGLLVIDDVVVNHGAQLLNSNDSGYPNFQTAPGYNLFYRDNSKQYAPPFDPGSGESIAQLFHNNGFIQDFTNTTQVELGSLEGLDDFRTESGYVQTNFANIYKFWMDQGFDGFRVDTVKNVDLSFWQNWCPQIHQHAVEVGKPDFFMFGEVYDRSETKNASYTGTTSGSNFELDSVLDYPLYFSINPVFALANSNTKQIEDHYHAVDATYDPSAQMRLVTFLDNHDQSRFLNSANANNNPQRLAVALVFLYTSRGVPCLYYGTEQGFNGGADPNNREDMFAGQFEQGPSLGDNFNETHPLFQLVAKLNNFRRLYPALRSGSHVSLWNNSSGPGLFAYSRVLGSQEVFVVFNTNTIAQTLTNRPTTYSSGTILTNLLDSNENITITSSQQTPLLNVPASTAKVFVAQSQVLPLDPVVTSISPAHDAKNVPTPSKIIIQFSKPMDTASVESGFATTPGTTGTFTWSSAHDLVTYLASGGLPELTTMVIQIAVTAAASDGTHLSAPFEERFTTAGHTVQDTTPPTIVVTAPAENDVLSDIAYVRGTASDNVNVATVEVNLDNGPWIDYTPGGTRTSLDFSQSIFTQFQVNGRHVISVRAIDAAGNFSPTINIDVTIATVPPAYEQRIFPYGSAGFSIQDCETPLNQIWDSDQPYQQTLDFRSYGYVGGNTARSQNSISNVCSADQPLYQFERYSSPSDGFRYEFACPPGIYQVEMLEAETFMNGPNQRRFDVYAQGQRVLQNFDIFLAAGGANLGITETFTATVSNNLLDLEFKPVFDNARVSAIHVKKIGDVASDPDGVPDWWRLMYFGHVNGLAEDQSRAQDDPDHDGFTNLQEALAGTDPFNPNSYFRITWMQDNGNSVYVDAYGVKNKVYQLQRCSSLAKADWVDVGSPQTCSTTGTVLLIEYGSIPNPKFYRVRIVP
jgi:glycosidase